MHSTHLALTAVAVQFAWHMLKKVTKFTLTGKQ